MHFPFSSFSSTGPADENERNDGQFGCHFERAGDEGEYRAERPHELSPRRVTIGAPDEPSKYGNELVL
jgi:hypothetical protein